MTIYKTRNDHLYQTLRKDTLNTQDEKNPIHQEIMRQSGVLNFVVEVREDKETVKDLKHINGGVVAFICFLKLSGELIGVGRSVSVIDDKTTKYFQKNVTYTKNASIIDAVVKSVKILDSLHSETIPQQNSGIKLDESYQVKVSAGTDSITEKQKNYLMTLIRTNVAENKRSELEKQMSKYTRDEANLAIKNYVK